MHVEVETKPVGPLSILDGLPGQKLAILEGLNGIGKTLTVKLLQICTGEMPYRTDSAAWTSLCDGLGVFRVVVSELEGEVRAIEWHGDSRTWQSGPGLGMSAVDFKSIKIDGRAGTIDDVRKWLVVERIAGDEGLVDALAQLAEADAEAVRVWSAKHASPEAGPLASLEQVVESARALIPTWSGPQYEELLGRTAALGKRRRDLGSSVQKLEGRRKQLNSALDLQRRAKELQGRAPELEARLRALDDRVSKAQEKRAELDRRISLLAGKVAMAKPARVELRNATRTLDRNRANLIEAARRAASAASALGLAADDAQAAADFVQLQRDELENLAAAQAKIDASPVMQGLLGQVADSLGTAEQRGFGNQIALEDTDGGIALTVSEARVGFVTRRRTLEMQPPPPEARDIADSITLTRTRLQRGMYLVNIHDELQRFRRLVQTNEERVTSALVTADPDAEAEMRREDKARRDLDEGLLALATERAALQEQLGAPSGVSLQQSLEEQLAETLEATNESLDSLADAAQKTDSDLTELQTELTGVERDLAGATKEQARVEADSRRAVNELLAGPFDWLSFEHPEIVDPDDPIATRSRIAVNDQARQVLDAVLDRLGAQRAQLGAVNAALRGIAGHIRGEDVSLGQYSGPLQDWLGGQFSAWFNLERVREQLLPDATGEVAVDVSARTVVWTEGSVTRTRPLDAFSSGEQAFAYTRARIGVLDERTHRPTNRLIVLDEFGAFISHDRMSQLLGYLRDRVAENPHDQVLVVLPLSRDYGELAATAVGKEGRRLAKLNEQITHNKYAVQVLA